MTASLDNKPSLKGYVHKFGKESREDDIIVTWSVVFKSGLLMGMPSC